jgi:ribosomal protein S25
LTLSQKLSKHLWQQKNEEETEAGMPPALKEAIEKKKEKEEESKAEQESEEVDASVLEDVELAEEADLSVGSEVSEEVENTRAALVDFVYNRLGKTNQKGE